MLVVSRKENQSVVFPSLGISVDIIRVAGRTVKVGIQAPSDIRILRGELLADEPTDALATPQSTDANSASKHELRNRLHQANLAMKLIEKQLACGQVEAAEESLAMALEAFSSIEKSSVLKRPSSEVAAADFPASESVDPAPSPFVKNGKRKRALLVEDDPNERALLASYLRSSGYDVDTACDGQEALEYLATQKPDAVVMDMQMPRLSGDQAVREIRSDYHFDDVKLYIVSGQEQSSTDVPSGDRGIQRWFQKPLDPDTLVSEMLAGLN